ncbi:MAG: ABC transporter, partial [Deltaproteobacteria bacterium]|nr:ABC transporter [Deltaproteobacteria bacterium]
IRELIREIGRERTVILSTHNLSEVRVTCGRVLIISQGEIVADDTPEELAARGGKSRFVATLRQNGHSASEIREAFSAIDDAGSVTEQTSTADGEVILELVPKGDQDLRAAIFQAAVSANLVLLGLEQRGENLEDIFRQLTTGAGASS